MKTPGTPSTATLVNVDTKSVTTGAAVLALIVAEVSRRPHLADGIESIQWEATRGVGILARDAGIRQHLANALHFDPTVRQFAVARFGEGFSRRGEVFGFEVTIWNVEF